MTKEFKLPRQFTENWLKALRSRKYKKGKGALYEYSTDSYCCLGVAAVSCSIDSKDIDEALFIQGDNFNQEAIKEFRKMGYPKELSTLDNFVKNGELANKLSVLNDTGDYTFEMIADWIEKNVELYDV